MNACMRVSRATNRYLERENRAWPTTLREIPREDWPIAGPPGIERVWRSQGYLVQQYAAEYDAIRLSIHRTTVAASGRWNDGITWDDLQRLKREAGFGDKWAVEIFPADASVVNDANMRHLWLLQQAPSFAWAQEKIEP